MDAKIYILPEDQRPHWLKYPESYCRILEQSLVNITPWHIMEADRVVVQYEGLVRRFPDRTIFPFAYRQDTDDVACWSEGCGESVFIIHDFASPGDELEHEFENVWEWFKDAVEDTTLWTT